MLLAAGLNLLGLFVVTEQMISRGTIDGTSSADVWNRKAFADGSIAEIRL